MCKRAGILAGWDYESKRILLTRANCNQWECDECSLRLRDRWVLRAKMGATEYMKQGLRVDFVTITSHEKLATFEQTEYVWRFAWDKLYKAIKRKAIRFEYFIVPEKHEDGRMHVHALWTAAVTKKWLKDNARSRGLGHQADVKKVEDSQRAADYVTKYVNKGIGQEMPKGFRRVRTSQKWTDIPEPVTDQSGLEWEYLNHQDMLERVMWYANGDDYQLIDAKTGELWDYEPV